MRTIVLGLTAAGLLAACSAEPAPGPEEAEVTSLKPGEYEITAKVDEVRSMDQTTPATRAKVGGPPTTHRACVDSDGSIAPDAFAEAGDKCTASSAYVRNGRLNMQLTCTRPAGQLTQLVDGDFKVDSFAAKLRTATYFDKSGDYEMTRTVAGKRVGDCPAASATSPTAPAGKAKP
ncbi:MAG: DUF3617 family protein [Sphingomicrobium sp.]